MSRRQHPTEKQRAKSSTERDPGRLHRHGHDQNKIRTQIAQAAARLMAEGLTDLQDAKQKAARQLGVTGSRALPDNHEIETALRTYFALFAGDSQQRELQALRTTALRAMVCLEQFSPWLTGAVLAGTANRFSAIELELIGVESKSFEMYLLNEQIEHVMCNSRQQESSRHAGGTPEIIYRLEFDQLPVMVALYQTHLARQIRFPRGNLKHDRAQRKDAETRFVARDTGP